MGDDSKNDYWVNLGPVTDTFPYTIIGNKMATLHESLTDDQMMLIAMDKESKKFCVYTPIKKP